MMTQEQRTLAEENIRLAYQCADRIKRKGSPVCIDDIRQICMVGLCYAAVSYDPSYGTCFSTLAYRCMLNEYREYVRKKHVPSISMDQCIAGTDIPIAYTLEDPFDLNHESIDSTEMQMDAETFLSSCPALWRQVTQLRMKGMRNKEIAQHLGITQSYVATIVCNIKNKFYQWMRRE